MEPKTVRHQERPILAFTGLLSGLPLGSTVATADGLLPVEHLTPGDRVITRDHGFRKLRWVQHRRVVCTAVRLSHHCLGHDRPSERMILPAGQHLLIRDWRAKALYGRPSAGVRVSRLIDGEYIKDVGARSMSLFYLGFDDREVLYVSDLQMCSHLISQVPGAVKGPSPAEPMAPFREDPRQ